MLTLIVEEIRIAVEMSVFVFLFSSLSDFFLQREKFVAHTETHEKIFVDENGEDTRKQKTEIKTNDLNLQRDENKIVKQILNKSLFFFRIIDEFIYVSIKSLNSVQFMVDERWKNLLLEKYCTNCQDDDDFVTKSSFK